MTGLWNLSRDQRGAIEGLSYPWLSGLEGSRVGVQGVGEDVRGGSTLDHLAGVHHRDLV